MTPTCVKCDRLATHRVYYRAQNDVCEPRCQAHTNAIHPSTDIIRQRVTLW